MDIQRITELLPEQPRPGMLEYVRGNCFGGLGPEFAVFNREPITLFENYYADMCMIMTPEQVEEMENKSKHVWGATVKCTYCGEEYTAGYIPQTKLSDKGVVFAEGDDGMVFPGYVDGKNPMCELSVYEGEPFLCPYCGESVELIHKSNLRHGRTYQIQVCSVENIELYTALVFWIVSRRINEYGYWTTDVKPREALVIDEKGKLRRFSHVRIFEHGVQQQLNKWQPRTSFSDSFQSKYYDWPSNSHNKIGGLCWTDVPDLLGSTGEKTGIAEYVGAGGNWPAIYLKTQHKYKAVENLMKCGWANAVATEIDDRVNTAINYCMRVNSAIDFRWGNFNEVKPGKILGITKDEVHKGAEWQWDYDLMSEWWNYRNTEYHCSATIFNRYYTLVGIDGVKQTMGMLEQGDKGYDLQKLMGYFERYPDIEPKDTLQYLIDVRTMATELSPTGELTFEQLWPRNLVALHDRLDRVHRSIKNPNERRKYESGFKKTYEKYKDLSWNDGELCIRVARTNGELIDEGNTLDHCVGGYGESHITGKDVIFFVRKYRRPERSYYTLDIRFTNGTPYEVQLHGYGNERHGEYKQYTHFIPTKVRTFVNRWKNEILKPWFLEQAKLQVSKEKTKKSRKKETVA